YYLCMEFLLGRSLKNNLFNLKLDEAYKNALEEYGVTLEELYEMEPDAGLGNGGLGRLAACFMDSLASQDYPAMGFSIRYEYGLFKQKIVDGWQTELPDAWLPGGEVWLTQRTDKVFDVKFDGYIEERWEDGRMVVEHKDATVVQAIGYDMMVSGYDSAGVSTLRLWRPVCKETFNMKSFSQGDYMNAMRASNEAEMLGKVLYPADDHSEGKSLRLKQQYLLVSASVQNIVRDHVSRFGDISTLPDHVAIHINDTHPALCIPELMRILLDEHCFSWEKAWDIVSRTVAYTNHTVLSEALERWQQNLIERKLPRIYSIIKEINQRFCAEMWAKFPAQWDRIERLSVLDHNQVKMANLSIVGSHHVNGVSALHSNIIKKTIFRDFYDGGVSQFTNVTNGIAYRRWLCQSNPGLSALLTECIGDGFYRDAAELAKFRAFADDKTVQKRLTEIKLANKQRLAQLIYKNSGFVVDPNTMFDVQAKRLHEYKRQLLNVLKIITLYQDLLEDPDKDVVPKTFLFGAKAAPGYYMAKQIIRLIAKLSEEIQRQPKIREKLNVVFLENYSVTMSEALMPAAEVSEQISLAGKEASGTGNMKFMINGAVTLGTMDGANVEIAEQAGMDNIFIFGMHANEVDELWKSGYNSSFYYAGNAKLKRAIDRLNLGFAGESFAEINNYLLRGQHIADPYMCCADYADYMRVAAMVDETYRNQAEFQRMAVHNIAGSAVFSADRSIKEYADHIWGLKPVKP
ncbi:MAG: glycogen/starch/alpha-glucan phosphorylase, partial [Clostridia bacterium]|nr:glycogen/starch/alpha-glucan phosphorylase [Clostridia bacterium]